MIFLVLILYALWGFTFTLGKLTLSFATPFFIIGSRMLMSGIGLMSYIYLTKRIHCYPTKSDRWYYLQGALFGIFLPYCARAWALQYMTSTKTAFMFNFMPFFTAIFAYFVTQERLTIKKLLGLVIGFLGMIPIFLTGTCLEDSLGSLGFLSWPEIAVLFSVACFGYNLVIMQTLVKHRGCAPILANGMSMLWGGLLAFTSSLTFESNWIHGNVYIFLGLLAIMIVVSNILCANIQAHLLKQYSSTFLAFAGFLSPLWAAFYGWLLLGETMTWHFFASLVMVFIGLWLFYVDEMKEKHVPVLPS